MTPEEAARKFMEAVADRRWKDALDYTQISWKTHFCSRPWNPAKSLREKMVPLAIEEVVSVGENDRLNTFRVNVPVVVRASPLEETETYEIQVMMIQEDGPIHPSSRGEWGANPVSCRRMKKVDA